MRAIFFILVGIALTLGAIHYLGPDRFMELYRGAVSTGQGMVSGEQPAQNPGAGAGAGVGAPPAQTGQSPAGGGAQ